MRLPLHMLIGVLYIAKRLVFPQLRRLEYSLGFSNHVSGQVRDVSNDWLPDITDHLVKLTSI